MNFSRSGLGLCPGRITVWRACWYSLILPVRLHRFDPQSGRHEVDAVAEDIGRIAPARCGGYVAGLRSGIWLLARAASSGASWPTDPLRQQQTEALPRIPGARLDVVRESGHLSAIDQPGQLADAI